MSGRTIFSIKINSVVQSGTVGVTWLAHEGLVAVLVVLGILLFLGYLLGPSKEIRLMKRNEAKVMLLPTAILLFILAAIIFSGVLDPTI